MCKPEDHILSLECDRCLTDTYHPEFCMICGRRLCFLCYHTEWILDIKIGSGDFNIPITICRVHAFENTKKIREDIKKFAYDLHKKIMGKFKTCKSNKAIFKEILRRDIKPNESCEEAFDQIEE